MRNQRNSRYLNSGNALSSYVQVQPEKTFEGVQS